MQQISRDKLDCFPRATTEFTLCVLDRYGLRGHWPARPTLTPQIRFLYIGSRFCSTLPSDPASQRRPCASLSLHLYQVVKRTYTSKLSNMRGVPIRMVAGPRNHFAIHKAGIQDSGLFSSQQTRVSLFRPTGVQNPPDCVAKLRRDSLSVLANHMSVDRLRDWRAVGVSESLPAEFLRCSANCSLALRSHNGTRGSHCRGESGYRWPEAKA